MAGRRPLNGTRMKPNGLPDELDAWFLKRGNELYGKGGGARLKREVLEAYRRETEQHTAGKANAVIPLSGDNIPQTLVAGE